MNYLRHDQLERGAYYAMYSMKTGVPKFREIIKANEFNSSGNPDTCAEHYDNMSGMSGLLCHCREYLFVKIEIPELVL